LYAEDVKQFAIERGLTESEGVNLSNEGTFMKAPNGKPTKIDERQWLQVRTKAFKDWVWRLEMRG
jgi:hypothetical protein